MSQRSLFLLSTLCVLLPALSCLADDEGLMEEVSVIEITPTAGVAIDRNRYAGNVQSADAQGLEQSQALDLTDFLNRRLGSVSVNSAQNNPLQADLQFRGFTASPLLGLPQGLAIYQGGARINEPLGDAVNWDLVSRTAIHRISLIGGSNPLFGLNTLGGAITLDMKTGFNAEGRTIEVYGGSHDRLSISAEAGGNSDDLGYYGSFSYFEESGWRALSDSNAMNIYAGLSWRRRSTSLDLSGQYGASELRGNGPAPIGLLSVQRSAIFTAPDITENDMHMLSLEGEHFFNDVTQLSINTFYRSNKTDSFNGDASELQICGLGATALLEGLEEEAVEDLGLDLDDVCSGQFASVDGLENFLNMTAVGLAIPEQFFLEDLSANLSGNSVLEDEAINNLSDRDQDSYGANLQLTFLNDLFGRDNQLVVGGGYLRGTSRFNARVELAALDPVSRSTQGLGTGTFIERFGTNVDTGTTSWSGYFTDTLDLGQRLSITLSGRYNNTNVRIEDRSGIRSELNGRHNFSRFNPAAGITYRWNKALNFYASYSESARAPTPIELSCNEGVFVIARDLAVEAGRDPDDVDFECRLPNAFLADPPLDQVVAKSFEVGVRGAFRGIDYHAGFFRTRSTNDIIFQTTGRSTGLFANVEQTERIGFETILNGSWRNLDWLVAYSYIDANFGDDFAVLSPNHMFANGAGEIFVSNGDKIPAIPDYQLKLSGDYHIGGAWSLGGDLICNGEQYLRGDESNQLGSLAGYAVVNVRAQYQVAEWLQIFARIDNVFDKDYENFGIVGESPAEILPSLTDQRPLFLGPGAPRAGWVGVRLRF